MKTILLSLSILLGFTTISLARTNECDCGPFCECKPYCTCGTQCNCGPQCKCTLPCKCNTIKTIKLNKSKVTGGVSFLRLF